MKNMMRTAGNTLVKQFGGLHKYICVDMPESKLNQIFNNQIPAVIQMNAGLVRFDRIEGDNFRVSFRP